MFYNFLFYLFVTSSGLLLSVYKVAGNAPVVGNVGELAATSLSQGKLLLNY